MQITSPFNQTPFNYGVPAGRPVACVAAFAGQTLFRASLAAAAPPWERTLRAALAGFGLPCAQLSYGGDAERYFVFNAEEIPAGYSDDAPEYERLLIQLHLFTTMRHNTTQICRAVKQAVFEAGFTYPSTIHAGPKEVSENDGKGQHIVFEFEGVQATGV